jgi:hypothetical protein
MAKSKTPSRKRGRPRLPVDKVKRVPLNMRTTPDVRAKIEAAAKRSGRSLAHQVEHMIEDALHEEFGGEEFFNVAKVLAFAVQEGELISRRHWYETPETIDKTAAFVVSFLDGYGRTFGDGPGATSTLDYLKRLKELRRLAEKMRSSESPNRDE